MGFAAPVIAPLAIGAGSALINKIGGKKQTQQVNPNVPEVQGIQKDFATFLQGLMKNPSGAGQTFTSDLQRQATGGIQQYLNQPSPEQQTYNKLNPGLMDMFNASGEDLTKAMFPLFQRGLQEGMGALSNSGAGRFSTTFERQGIDLTSRAMQDFNLLQQQAFQQNVQNRLGAAQLLGTLSGQAGQAPFDRLVQAMQLGTQATASNPILQLLLGGMNFAQPQGMDTIVGDSPADAALKGISAWSMMKPSGGNAPTSWAEVWGAH